MPLLDRRTVSRKTPHDGKLEISESAAATLRALGPAEGEPLAALVNGTPGEARVVAMDCTCQRGSGEHRHHFLESALFRALVPGTEVSVHLDAERGLARVDAAR